MKSTKALSVMVVAVATGLTGCSTSRLVQKLQAPTNYRTETVEEVEKDVSDRDAAIKTLNASVLITASTGGSKEGLVKEYTSFKGYIFVQQPGRLRVLLQVPLLGSRALDMVSDGSTFTLMRATASKGDVWVQGTNEVKTPSKNGLENLRPPVFLDSLLVPGVKAGEFVTLTESTRVLRPDQKHKNFVEEPVYELDVLKQRSGSILEVERVVKISRVTGLPYEQDIYEGGALATQAKYDGYQTFDGQQFPTTITIRRPKDEYTLKVAITKLTLNETFDADQFKLDIPPGVTVTKME
jgi:outer membrane lipoprotein-sorting protein